MVAHPPLRVIRHVPLSFAAVAVLAIAACAPAAPPSPTAAPPKPPLTAAPAKPTESPKPAAKPTEAPAAKPAEGKPAASPAAKAVAKPAEKPPAKAAPPADWQTQWERTLAAAKREGVVTVAGGPGALYRDGLTQFPKAYPDIKLEFTGTQGRDFAPKTITEREAGQYLWDVHVGGAETPIATLKPRGLLDPLRPALLLPEILDDSKWLGGVDEGWVDRDKQHVFYFEARINHPAYINRDLVPLSELNNIDQLLDPKWKGKIATQDTRVAGAGSGNLGYVNMLKGEDYVRKLLTQDLTVLSDARQLAEGLIRGRYPIAMGVNSADLEQFRMEGLLARVEPIDPEAGKKDGARITNGFGTVMLINRAPHRNAAIVYINWLLSKAGQEAYVKATNLNSRRLDVQGPEAFAPRQGVKYLVVNKEENQHYINKAIDISKELLKS